MTEQDFIGTLEAERDWRIQELEFCKKIPFVYANSLFRRQESKYWRLCVPIVYAHWEGFVVSALKILVTYINEQGVCYNEVAPSILLMDNKSRFGYLQGNCTISQQTRFLNEFIEAQRHPIALQQNNVTANSNLSFQQLGKMLNYFDLDVSDILIAQKSHIEKLVQYRNSIAHGENSIAVTKKHIEDFIQSDMICIDEIISILSQYIISKLYLS